MKTELNLNLLNARKSVGQLIKFQKYQLLSDHHRWEIIGE